MLCAECRLLVARFRLVRGNALRLCVAASDWAVVSLTNWLTFEGGFRSGVCDDGKDYGPLVSGACRWSSFGFKKCYICGRLGILFCCNAHLLTDRFQEG